MLTWRAIDALTPTPVYIFGMPSPSGATPTPRLGTMPRCKFIDDAAKESDGDEEDHPGAKPSRKRRRRLANSSDEEQGDEVMTAEDIAFVASDHESEGGDDSPVVHISKKERRPTRDDFNLACENVGLRKKKFKNVRGRPSVYKDSDESDLHSSDEGFVVSDGSGEECDSDEDDVADSAKGEEDESEAEEEEEYVDAFVLDSSNLMSEALRFRREVGMESVRLEDVIARMHLDGRWILGMEFLRNDSPVVIPPLFVREFSARCKGSTVVTADVVRLIFGGRRVPVDTLVDIPFVPDGEEKCDDPKGDTKVVAPVTDVVSVTSPPVTPPLVVAPTPPPPPLAPAFTLVDDFYAEDMKCDFGVASLDMPPAPPVPVATQKAAVSANPSLVSVFKKVGSGSASSVPSSAPPVGVYNVFAAAKNRVDVVPVAKPSSKKPGGKASEPRTGLIMRSDGSTYFLHEDGTIEERGRL